MKSINGNSVESNLNDYGSIFQHKLLYALMVDKYFFEQIYEILNPDLFDISSINWIVRVIKKHYNEYNNLPDLDSFKVYLVQDEEVTSNVTLKYSIVKSLQDAYNLRNSKDLDFVKKQALDFFKNQNIAQVIYESIDLLKRGEYDLIKNKLDEAFRAGENNNIGHNYNIEIEERYTERTRNTISTGWNIIDQYLDGGLGEGELGVILAMSSVGKSWFLCHLSTNMIMNGKNVVYYNLEDTDSYIGIRIDSILTGINTCNLKYQIDKVKEVITDKVKGNLVIKDFPSEITNINHLTAHINRLKLLGKEPDVIIIDYGDVMAPLKRFQQDWLNQRQIFQEIKSFAQLMKKPVWTASQANQVEGSEMEVQATAMQRAYAKVAPCNVILGLSRRIEDKLSETGRLHLAKNKFGPDGVTFPCKINNDKGIFKIYNPSTEMGKETLEKMNVGGELLKKRLSEKFKEFKQEN